MSTSEGTDYERIAKYLAKAIECYPKEVSTHKKLISLIDKQLDEAGTQHSKEDLQRRLVAAQEQMVRYLPDEIETSLELIDHYFDEDELDKAHVLVKQLSVRRGWKIESNPLPRDLTTKTTRTATG